MSSENNSAPATLPVERSFGGEVVLVERVFRVPGRKPAGDGPWSAEAEKIAWKDPLTGYDCIILRAGSTGCLGGYVAIGPRHPLHLYDVTALGGVGLEVHGGVNYAEGCERGGPEETTVSHRWHGRKAPAVRTRSNDGWPAWLGEDWWLGFSCDHEADLIPFALSHENQAIEGVVERVYRDEAYVFAECRRLAAQLKRIELASLDSGSELPRLGDETEEY